jgi:putative transposase
VNETLESLCNWRKLEIIEKNVQKDHVHIILEIPPKYSVSETIGYLKGKSAIKVFNCHAKLKRRYWGRHFWAQGYCVSTVGLEEEKIRQYVKWQLEQDRRMDQLDLLDR